jgi:hypothetical protein
VGNVDILAELFAVQLLVIHCMKTRVNGVQWWGGVFLFAKDGPAVHVVQKGVKFVRLIGEASVIDEDVLPFPSNASYFGRDADRGLGWWGGWVDIRQRVGNKTVIA